MSRIEYVTTDGVTPSQPGLCVGTNHTMGTNVWTLSVFRSYPNLRNSWGGLGVHHYADCHRMEFNDPEKARAYLIERGYVTPFYVQPSIRARRKEVARNPKTLKEAA